MDDITLSRYKLDLFKLKRWGNENDSPADAAFEIFKSFAAYWNLVIRLYAPWAAPRRNRALHANSGDGALLSTERFLCRDPLA